MRLRARVRVRVSEGAHREVVARRVDGRVLVRVRVRVWVRVRVRTLALALTLTLTVTLTLTLTRMLKPRAERSDVIAPSEPCLLRCTTWKRA